MQLKTFLATLIVLPALVSAQDEGLLHQIKPGFTKRSPMSLEMQPLYLAKRGIDTAKFEARALLQKRQCPALTTECTGLGICCPTNTVCGTYGGQKGCCPTGKTCTGVENCPTTQVDCKSFCCPAGSTCGTSAAGVGVCNAGTDNGECGVKGYSACKNMAGCCPTGVECVPPNKCDVKCTAADPKCGDGCCLKGSRCTADLTCVLESGGDLTSISGSKTTTKTSTATGSASRTITTASTSKSTGTRSSTDTLDANADSSTTSATTTNTRRTTTSSQTILPGGNAAATAGVDGLLGVAAGIMGYLVL